MMVVSIGGVAADNSDNPTTYEMWLELPFTQPSLNLERVTREGGDPVVTRATREPFTQTLHVQIYGATEAATKVLREALLSALDTDAAAIPLIVSDDDGGALRYRYVVVQSVDEQRPSQGAGAHLAATLVTHGESRWRSVTATTATWNITASGQTTVIANNGSLPARPTYTVQPTASNVTEFGYRLFVAIKWQGRAAEYYPISLSPVGSGLDTAQLIIDGKLSGENNLAVVVDGLRRKRWIANYDTALTQVWVNLDFIYCPSVPLKVGMGAGDSITEIVADSSIALFPFSGSLVIDTEVFTYSGKRDADNTFTGVVRAAKGSVADDHVAGYWEDDTPKSEIWLLQHDIWLLYGGGGSFTNTDDTIGPTVEAGQGEDTLKPMFELAVSSNRDWYWEYFGQADTLAGVSYKHRPMSWQASQTEGVGVGGDASSPLYKELLLWTSDRFGRTASSWWWIPTAHRVAEALAVGRRTLGSDPDVGVFTAGIGLVTNGFVSDRYIDMAGYSNEDLYLITTRDAAWSDSMRFYLTSPTGAVQLSLDKFSVAWQDYPLALPMAEEAVYDLDLLLENVTTGLAITLDAPMGLNQHLEVNTEEHTARLTEDGTNQYQALQRSTRRREILPLQPGNNTLRVTEDGLAGMTITIEFEERSYS